jgi:ribosome maturation factor RimP
MASIATQVEEIVRAITDDLGLDLYDFEYGPGQVKVTIDRPGGVDLEAITKVTRMLSRDLDHSDPIPGEYTIEVSSPGLERPLRRPDHFTRIIGWNISVKTKPFVDGDRRVAGVLVAADEDGCTVRLDDLSTRRLAYDDIEKARTVFVDAPKPKPGSPEAKRLKQLRAAVEAAQLTGSATTLAGAGEAVDSAGLDENDPDGFDDELDDDEFFDESDDDESDDEDDEWDDDVDPDDLEETR